MPRMVNSGFGSAEGVRGMTRREPAMAGRCRDYPGFPPALAVKGTLPFAVSHEKGLLAAKGSVPFTPFTLYR